MEQARKTAIMKEISSQYKKNPEDLSVLPFSSFLLRSFPIILSNSAFTIPLRGVIPQVLEFVLAGYLHQDIAGVNWKRV